MNVSRLHLPIATVVATILVGASGIFAQPSVLVDQLGYRPDDPKVAFLKNGGGIEFLVVEVRTNKSVFKGTIQPTSKRDAQTGDALRALDFTRFRKPGSYQLWIPGANIFSPEFRIAGDVYRPVVDRTIESYYFQRCGTVVGQQTIWNHPACHLEDSYFFDNPGLWRDVRGGWHDAGDYGKFIATGALTAAFLLYAYEYSPSQFDDGQLTIPESNNGIPDILDEARWELEWMLKMQTPDGGVFHKTSTKKWTGEYLPHLDPDRRFIFGVSTTATAAVAAVTALAARVFDRWDKNFARTLLKSSLNAWAYLREHKQIVPAGGFKNPPGVEGGEYEDKTDSDERLWAAVELYRLTGHEDIHDYIRYNHRALGGFSHAIGWQNVQNFAYASYLRMRREHQDPAVAGFLSSTLAASCDALIKRIEESAYRYVLRDDEYYWGSNSVALGYAFSLLLGHEIKNQPKYLEAALDQLHFILGRNTFGQTFVTGVGTHPVKRPYHQFSMMLGAGEPVPGLVVGGPNKNSKLKGKTISHLPGKCYEDVEKNYFVNEVAINYTAPLTYVAALLLETPASSTKQGTPTVVGE